MKHRLTIAASMLLFVGAFANAQEANVPSLGEVVVTANRLNARYAQQDRPIVGLRRQADSAVMSISIASDSRDMADRKREIHAMVVAAMDRAAGAGIGNVQQKITRFVKSVPVTGRSQMKQKGGLALTIIKPSQYRDEIYRRIAEGAKHAGRFYGTEYGVNVTGLDNEIARKQLNNSEVFLYIPYSFSIGK